MAARVDAGAPLSHRMTAIAVGRVLLLLFAAVMVGVVLVRHAGEFAFSESLRLVSAVALIGTISSLAQVYWTRRGRQLRQFVLVQLLLDQALVTVVVYLTGGAGSPATSLYGVTCLAGGLLLGVPGTVATGIAGGVFFSLFVLLDRVRAILPPIDQPRIHFDLTADQTASYLVVNLLVLALVSLLVSYLVERLEQASGELVEARRRADQAERMAALGRLAAGLAHEIRNPLSSISASIQILKGGVEAEEDAELCEIIHQESRRLDELVSDMVDLSRTVRPQLALTDIGSVASDVVQLATRSGRAMGDVAIRRLGAEHVWVMADPGQYRQMVWNLVRNAVQASASGSEVRVRVECGETVRLTVEDDGVGIDPAAREQLFDAFFTTRSQGSGIGLAVVQRIATEHGFGLRVESDAGRGALFEVDMGPPEASPTF